MRGFLLTVWSLVLSLIAVNTYGQNSISISGRVTSDDGEPLPGAAILLHELNTGVVTDDDGYFVLKEVKKGHYHLHVHYVSFEAQTVDIHAEEKDVELKIVMKPSNLELHSVVVEDNFLKTEKKELSQSMEVADESFLEKSSGTNFVNSLDKLAGVNSISTGTNVSKPVIRGFSFNRVIVTENGVKQEGQQWGADHGLEVDQYNVNRVEIVKGPASLQYGSDGMGGVLAIKPALPPKENSVEAEAMVNGKSNNNMLGSSAMLGINKKGSFIRFRFSTQDFGDYRVPADSFVYNSYVLPIVEQKLKNTAGRERNINSTIGLNKRWGYTHLTVSNYATNIGFFAGSHGVPRANNLVDDGDDRNIDNPRQEVNHFKVISNSSVIMGKNWLEWDMAFQRNDRKEFSYPHTHGFAPTPDNDLELNLILDTYSASVRFHLNQSEKYHQVHGLSTQAQRQDIGGYGYLIPKYSNYGIGGFTYHKYKVSEKLVVNAGLRFDYATVSIQSLSAPSYDAEGNFIGYTEINPNLSRSFFNFSGAAGISWFIKKNWNVKVNLGSAYKIPTVPELASNGVHHGAFRHELGDTTLTSERSYQLDLGLSHQNKDFVFSLSPYFNYFPNFIFLNPTSKFSPLPEAGQLYQYTQSEAIHTGVDLSLDYHITKNLHFGLNGDYVWAHNLESGYPMPFTPPASVVTEMEYEFTKLPAFLYGTYIGLSSRTTAPQNRVARNELATEGFQLFHAMAGTDFNIGKQTLTLRFQVNNLLDTKYYVHLNQYRLLNIPEPGRNFQLSLKLKLNYDLKTKNKTE